MRIEKKVTYEATRTVCEKLVCDLCGRETTQSDWHTDLYDTKETKISYRDGKCYPGEGFGTEYSVDLCPECFQEKLIPWIKSHGGQVREEEWDY